MKSPTVQWRSGGTCWWSQNCSDAGVRNLGPFTFEFEDTFIEVPNEIWALDTGGTTTCSCQVTANSGTQYGLYLGPPVVKNMVISVDYTTSKMKLAASLMGETNSFLVQPKALPKSNNIWTLVGIGVGSLAIITAIAFIAIKKCKKKDPEARQQRQDIQSRLL